MTQVNVQEAKTHLSRLIELVLQGEEVVIAKRNQPVVRLVPELPKKRGKAIGSLKDLLIYESEDCWEPEDYGDYPIFPEQRKKD